MSEENFVPTWRIVLAAILDFFMAFGLSGFAVASIFGGKTENGFELNGLPAILCLLLVGLYFWAFPKFFDGRIWQRILKAVR